MKGLTSEYSAQDPSPRFVPIASMHGKEKPSPAKEEGHQRQKTDQQLSVLTLRKTTCNFIKKSLRQCGKEITQQGRFEGIQVKHLGKVRTTVAHFHFQKPGRPCFKAMEPKGTTTWSAPMTTLWNTVLSCGHYFSGRLPHGSSQPNLAFLLGVGDHLANWKFNPWINLDECWTISSHNETGLTFYRASSYIRYMKKPTKCKAHPNKHQVRG